MQVTQHEFWAGICGTISMIKRLVIHLKVWWGFDSQMRQSRRKGWDLDLQEEKEDKSKETATDTKSIPIVV